MAKELLVKLEIPIPAEPLVGTPDMIFSRWLPLGEEMAIRVQEDGVALKLWFDITSTWWASQPQESDLPKMVNVCAHRIFAEVRVDNVKDEVVDYITHRDFKRLPTEAEQSLQQQYDDLGRRILTLLLQRLNKLIAFVRSVKGQFWLTEYPLNLDRMHSTFMEFKGQVRTDEGGWYRFEPATGDHLVITLIPEEKFIDQDTWRRAQEFTCGSSRSPLVGPCWPVLNRLRVMGTVEAP